MTPSFHESTLESLCLSWLQDRGYAALNGPAIAPGEPAAERAEWREAILAGRLRAVMARSDSKALVEEPKKPNSLRYMLLPKLLSGEAEAKNCEGNE